MRRGVVVCGLLLVGCPARSVSDGDVTPDQRAQLVEDSARVIGCAARDVAVTNIDGKFGVYLGWRARCGDHVWQCTRLTRGVPACVPER